MRELVNIFERKSLDYDLVNITETKSSVLSETLLSQIPENELSHSEENNTIFFKKDGKFKKFILKDNEIKLEDI